jgi:DNA phosphorothioation-associated putative methyltransferase
MGYDIEGWDPAFRPAGPQRESEVVNLGYVVNVIEDAAERNQVLQSAWALARSVLVVAARPDWEARSVLGRAYGDGLVTGKGTFQKFYAQEELRAWIDTTLGVQSIAAAPGIFYVFRDDVRAQSFLAARVRYRPLGPRPRRPRASELVYEANREILDALTAFVEARGRAPEAFELPEAASIQERFGSIRAALTLIRRVTGDEAWQAARTAAIEDLTVYLALAAFGRRPKFGGLPEDIQIDVRTFFGSYREACSAADDLLFNAGDRLAIDAGCKESPIGKLTPDSLYVHAAAIGRLNPLLRVYEGCARALTGSVEGATVVKLNRLEPRVSYLVYPRFDEEPHPALQNSVRADLAHLRVRFQDFSKSANPPILHRKETFVPADYPGYAKFARLTVQEERHGLFTEPTGIGTKNAWAGVVAERGLRFRGHQLVKRETSVGDAPPAAPQPPVIELPRPAEPLPPVMTAPRLPPEATRRCRHGVAVGACAIC